MQPSCLCLDAQVVNLHSSLQPAVFWVINEPGSCSRNLPLQLSCRTSWRLSRRRSASCRNVAERIVLVFVLPCMPHASLQIDIPFRWLVSTCHAAGPAGIPLRSRQCHRRRRRLGSSTRQPPPAPAVRQLRHPGGQAASVRRLLHRLLLLRGLPARQLGGAQGHL